MIADPCLRFWLHAAHSEGALFEYNDGVARTLLPVHLQEQLRVPELLAVTADPDAAEEDPQALFLVPGHPVLESMSARVIARGDAGHAYLPWPSSAQPLSASLLDRVRADIDVDHGRIDLDGNPARVYRPLLRLGVLVTYRLDDHFQEREETWADAHAGVALDAASATRLNTIGSLTEPNERSARIQVAFLDKALAAAHRALLARVKVRSAALERQSRGTSQNELARSEAYYDAALRTLERRRGAAAPERLKALDKQAQVLQTERERRRHEIQAKFEVSYALQPYRAHLLHVPALAVPVMIRRGERRYPFELCWLLTQAVFLPPVCPACGAQSRLVAQRARLACVACAGS